MNESSGGLQSKPVVVKEEVDEIKIKKACSHLHPADVRMSSESK